MATLDHAAPVPGVPAHHLLHAVRLGTVTTICAAAAIAGSALDGMLVALVAAYLVGLALTTGTAHLGLGLVEPLIGLVAGLVALAIPLGLFLLVRAVARRVGRAVARRAGPRALPRILGLPLRAARAIVRRLSPWALGPIATFVVVSVVVPNDGVGRIVQPSPALTPLVLAAALAGLLFGVGRLGLLRLRAEGAGHLRIRGAATALALAAGAAVVVTTAGLAIYPGDASGLVPSDPRYQAASAAATSLVDPGAPGPFAVRNTAYGSGTDAHRAVFGPDVPLRTPAVDASKALALFPGLAGDAYRWFWGFDLSALPLNALVWYPEGDGPFPLVLVVHGNHTAGEFSEPGYAYLGEHLASRGMVVASIDEDFLNGAFYGDFSGNEMAVRAWLLLRHLELWRGWTADPASTFHGLADLDRVALIGHSRGGEASSVAAVFTRLSEAPQTGLTPWPTGLSVRAVVSIAPSDGQYTGGTTMEGTDFLTISGGQDADASAWSGIRQYGRVLVRPNDGLKAAFWAYRANHGQFSTVWGTSDQGPLATWAINRAALDTPEEQRRVASVVISAFLAVSLQGRDEYRSLFRMPSPATAWLPDDIYLVRSSEANDRLLVDPDRSGTGRYAAGVTEEREGTVGGVLDLPLRSLQPTQQNVVFNMRWTAGSGRPAYRLRLAPSVARGLGADATLRFALANGGFEDAGPLDPSIVLTTADGVRVALPLSRWGTLPPPLPSVPMKPDPLAGLVGVGPEFRSTVERVLQTYALPLSEFAAADPAFDPARIATIEFAFDGSTAGGAYIDEIAFGGP